MQRTLYQRKLPSVIPQWQGLNLITPILTFPHQGGRDLFNRLISISREPGVAELGDGLESGVGILLARFQHSIILGVASSEGFSVEGVVREEDGGGSAQGEDGGSLVNGRAELEFFGGHEAGGAEHSARAVGEWTSVVGVEVNGVELAAVEVVDHGAVVEVVGYPAALGEFGVQVVDFVQKVQDFVDG